MWCKDNEFFRRKAKFDVIMNRIKSYKIKNSSNKKIKYFNFASIYGKTLIKRTVQIRKFKTKININL